MSLNQSLGSLLHVLVSGRRWAFAAATAGLLVVGQRANAEINFSVTFTAQALSDLSAAEQALFTNGVNFWDDIITGYRDGVTRNWTLNVDTYSEAAEGGGVSLGFAGPSGVVLSNVVPGSGLGGTWPNRFILSSGGDASFNVHPDAGALSELVIRHEIGHALGIGTLWEDNEVYNDGISSNSNRTLSGGTPGQYTGAAALAAYQTEFDGSATYIPIELDGGAGTRHGHWNEVTDNFAVENSPGFDSDPGDGGPAPTDSLGRSLDDELMTGVLSGTAYLSDTTIMSLYDIGYTVVPEPSTLYPLAIAGLLVMRRRRRVA